MALKAFYYLVRLIYIVLISRKIIHIRHYRHSRQTLTGVITVIKFVGLTVLPTSESLW